METKSRSFFSNLQFLSRWIVQRSNGPPGAAQLSRLCHRRRPRVPLVRSCPLLCVLKFFSTTMCVLLVLEFLFASILLLMGHVCHLCCSRK